MSTLTVKDLLPLDTEHKGEQTTTIRSLSREELRRISGGQGMIMRLNAFRMVSLTAFQPQNLASSAEPLRLFRP